MNNCAWCGDDTNDPNGSHGICSDCMRLHFGIPAQEIYDEIDAEFGADEQELVEEVVA